MPLSPPTTPIFCELIDAPPSTTVASPRSIGGTTLAVASAAGLGTPSGSSPLRITVIRSSDSARVHFKVTAISGMTLTVAVTDGYTDIALAAGDAVYAYPTVGTFSDIHTAILAIDTFATAAATAINASAPLESPALTGTPTAPTPTSSDSSTAIATTAFVKAQGYDTAAQVVTYVTGLGYAVAANNLSDLASASASRTNLGLGTAATAAASSFSPVAGSTSIVTVGTIATGTWQASPVGVAYLGSGTPTAGKYLDGDGAWTTLPAGGGVPGGTAGRVPFETTGGALVDSTNLTYNAGVFGCNGASIASNGAINAPGMIYGYLIGGSPVFASSSSILFAYAQSSGIQFRTFGDTTDLLSIDPGGSICVHGLASYAVSPAAFSASVNDFAPGVGAFQRWSSTTTVTITGMVATGPGNLAGAGQACEIRHFCNVGTNAITLTNQDAASVTANRWLTTTGASIVIGPNQIAKAIYDTVTGAWRVSLLP